MSALSGTTLFASTDPPPQSKDFELVAERISEIGKSISHNSYVVNKIFRELRDAKKAIDNLIPRFNDFVRRVAELAIEFRARQLLSSCFGELLTKYSAS